MPTTHRLRTFGLVACIAASAAVLASCGSSSSSGSSSSASTQAAATGAGGARRSALRACLQQHGVTLPQRPAGSRPPGAGGGYGPPPGAGGGGFFGGGGPGSLAQRNPKLAAALKACGARFGPGGRRFGLQRASITKYVSCVRSHGYNLPSPNFSGKGPVFPASIQTNPKFQAASRLCQSLLFPRRGGGGTGQTTTSSSTA